MDKNPITVFLRNPQEYYYYHTPGCGIMDNLEGQTVRWGNITV
jgi:hypothetical protein